MMMTGAYENQKSEFGLYIFIGQTLMYPDYSDLNGEPDDLWDFGTVRHAGRTIGRGGSVRNAGPPLTWENEPSPTTSQFAESKARRSPTTSTSNTYDSQSTARPGYPQGPPSPTKSTSSRFEPSTVRHMNAVPEHQTPRPVPHSRQAEPQRAQQVQREPSDEYEGYDDTYEDSYPSNMSAVHDKMDDLHLDDDLSDTTMLDSVILPAIASVSILLVSSRGPSNAHLPSALSTSSNARSQDSVECSAASIYRGREDHPWSDRGTGQ